MIQSRSALPRPLAKNKYLFERRQRACAICHHYGYRPTNKIKQIASNFTAKKLAEGYVHIFKKPLEKSLFDAYIHEHCFRRLYSSYRYHHRKQTEQEIISHHEIERYKSNYTPHETRSRSNLRSSIESRQNSCVIINENEMDEVSVEQFLSAPLAVSNNEENIHAQFSARSDRFRPCMSRVSHSQATINNRPKFF